MKGVKRSIAIVPIMLSLMLAACYEDSPLRKEKNTLGPGSIQAATVEFNESFLGVTELEFTLLAGAAEANVDDRTNGGGHGNHGGGHGEGKDKDKDKDKDHENDDEEEDADDDDDEEEGDDDDDDDGDPGGEEEEEEEGNEGQDVENGGTDAGDEGSDNGPASLLFQGKFVVDLLNGSSTPDFGVAGVTPGSYKSIRLRLEPILPGGKSVFFSTTITPNQGRNALIVEFSLKSVIAVRIEGKDGVILNGSDLKQFRVLLDLDELFMGIDFGEATLDSRGIIVINEVTNVALMEQIKTKLPMVITGG